MGTPARPVFWPAGRAGVPIFRRGSIAKLCGVEAHPRRRGGFSFEGVVLPSDPQICRDNEFDSFDEDRPTCSTHTPIAGR